MSRGNTAVTTQSETKNSDRAGKTPQRQIVWLNVYFIAALHLMALYGIYLLPTANPRTWVWAWLGHIFGGLGVTAGAHRLWCHRSYKAVWPLRLFLMLVNCIAGQNDIFEWVRDHRVHHKYAETDGDPHNAKRGFFFSHVGWLMVKKHPDVIKKGKLLDLSDLLEDEIVMFQRRHYNLLGTLFNVLIPTVGPWYLWNESLYNGFFIAFALRYTFTLNCAWCVNSFAHMWGTRPYDKSIASAESMTAIITSSGEGFHNFHHSFPQDYATSEYPSLLNFTKMLIDVWRLLGLAYDLKTVSKESVLKKRMRSGDLQHLKEHTS
ncbi:unnamed protein product [Porites evermanni]|uniref:Uncharacterized protein n=1 Tax=Porites evermanni TaxID=104178 RepID=A0ABN8SEW4_9CNID|nr:unnamed protein product [Porites evermanni]